VPDVITLLVLAQVTEVEPDPTEDGAIVALQEAVQPPDHLPFETSEDLFRRRGNYGPGVVHASVLRSGSAADHALPQRKLGGRDDGEDALDDVVRADPVGERPVRQHEPVA
jgi:hypothetical protein